MTRFLTVLLSSIVITAHAQEKTSSVPKPPAFSSIKEADLKRDLFELASDEMRGKRAGTQDELRAAAWVAEQARKQA